MKAAIVFPGQGSQSVGMLGEWARDNEIIQRVFADASEALGYDLWDVVQNGPEERLNSTEVTQPAMLTAGVAAWSSWLAAGGSGPAMMAGHSLGEYTALVCAGAIGFQDAVQVVAERGRLMQAAVPAGEGAMAAILGLDDEVVIDLCAKAAEGEVVEAVNFNSPGQVVISGQAGAVDRAVAQASEAGAKRALKLAVSVPSHSSLMQDAAQKLGEKLAAIEIGAPRIPVLHNVNAASFDDPGAIREALVSQLHKPVQWVKTVNTMREAGVDTLIEMGPGKVLAGLTRRIDRSLNAYPVFDDPTMEKALAATKE